MARITSELREAKSITTTGAATLVFQKVDASLDRHASPANFNAELTVTYQLSNGHLSRQVTPGGSAQVLADEVYGFETVQLPNRNVQVRLTFLDNRQVRTYETQVAVPSQW